LILVDGLNVAYWCGAPAGLRLPLILMTALIERGEPALLCFDASTPHRLTAEDRAVYDELTAGSAFLIEVPSGKPADRIMLRHARLHDGRIVTRDKFADHRRRYRRLVDDPARLLSGYVAQDVLHVPALSIETALPASAREAWLRLRAYD
jgi:hypothetical protein